MTTWSLQSNPRCMSFFLALLSPYCEESVVCWIELAIGSLDSWFDYFLKSTQTQPTALWKAFHVRTSVSLFVKCSLQLNLCGLIIMFFPPQNCLCLNLSNNLINIQWWLSYFLPVSINSLLKLLITINIPPVSPFSTQKVCLVKINCHPFLMWLHKRWPRVSEENFADAISGITGDATSASSAPRRGHNLELDSSLWHFTPHFAKTVYFEFTSCEIIYEGCH